MKRNHGKSKKGIRFRLQTKFLIGIFLLETVLMSAIFFVVEFQMHESILDEFLKRGLSVTRNLAAINKDFVITYNYVKIEQNLERVVEENSLLYGVVEFFDGEVAGYQGRLDMKPVVVNSPLHEKTQELDEILIQYGQFDGEQFCDIAAPIFLKEESWGTVRAGFSLTDMQAAVVRTRQALLGLGVIGLIFGYLASVFLARRITRPIGNLVASVRAISSGEYQDPIRVNTQDEIGYLGNHFEAMRETIQQQFQLLADTNLQLSASNEYLQHEIAERRKIEDELRESEARLANAQRIAKLGFWEWNRERNRLHWSIEVREIFGTSVEESNGTYKDFLEFVHPEDRQLVEQAIHQVVEHGARSSIEHRIIRPDGSERIVQQEIEASFDEIGGEDRIVGTVQDVTERKQAEQRIRYLAFYDHVTGLPNRTFLKDHLNHTLIQAAQTEQTTAVMFLDLDHFKRINDTLGHSTGDRLLQEVANRLSHCIREYDYLTREQLHYTDEPEAWNGINTVARLGGDEFVIVLSRLRYAEDASVVAHRINQALSQPFSLEGNDVYITTSIGISIFPVDGSDAESLLKHADAAMYHAKSRGRNRHQFYAASMNAHILERLSLEASLRTSLEAGHFILHYQPRADIRTGQIIGMEALVRWLHPTRGLVPPSEFIPIAEETGLIVPLGKWVLNTACAQTKAWQSAGRPPLRVSVNLSAVQFNQRGLRKTVVRALEATGLEPKYLELELTESLIMENLEASIKQLNELSAIGVQLSIDDFGTGYSSLSYLKRFPIDSLKIDQSFIRDITSDPDDAAIVTATIALGHILRLKVVAEGVEREAQLELLRSQNCDEIQGNLLSRPLAPEAFAEYVLGGTGVSPLLTTADSARTEAPPATAAQP
jgi:PAS domain S-box-containing protein